MNKLLIPNFPKPYRQILPEITLSLPLFFIHPPKSGGSTVRTFFDLNLGSGQFSDFLWNRSRWNDCKQRFSISKFGGGHLSFGYHRALKMAVDYTTILREPLARQISHFHYARSGKNGEVSQGVPVSLTEAGVLRGDISIDEWVSESYDDLNLLTKMVSGHSNPDPTSLQVAKNNLRAHFCTVGTCEDMSSYLLRLCATSGLQMPFYVEANRANPKSPASPVSEAAKHKFLEANRLDVELYREASTLIAQDEQSYGQTFVDALEQVKHIQRQINAMPNPHVHNSFAFGFDDEHLAKVRTFVKDCNLDAVQYFLTQAREAKCHEKPDLYEGHVDGILDGVVRGWALNFTRPADAVHLKVVCGDRVIATGRTGEPRADVQAAGYETPTAGFSIPLPTDVLSSKEDVHVLIEGNSQRFPSSGPWRLSWHLA